MFKSEIIKSTIDKRQESSGNVLLESDMINHDEGIRKLASELVSPKARRKPIKGKKTKSVGQRRPQTTKNSIIKPMSTVDANML